MKLHKKIGTFFRINFEGISPNFSREKISFILKFLGIVKKPDFLPWRHGLQRHRLRLPPRTLEL
jgi:hypothetical protein